MEIGVLIQGDLLLQTGKLLSTTQKNNIKLLTEINLCAPSIVGSNVMPESSKCEWKNYTQ